jgi:hypothetical protein
LKIKLKGRHFETIEVMEAESQAVLNSLTKHGFQDAFKNGRSAGSGAYARKGTTSRVMVANRPTDNSTPDGSTSLGEKRTNVTAAIFKVDDVWSGAKQRNRAVSKIERKWLLTPPPHPASRQPENKTSHLKISAGCNICRNILRGSSLSTTVAFTPSCIGVQIGEARLGLVEMI